ncbi:MAG: chromate efflux transporter [Thermoleophilia bacterium]
MAGSTLAHTTATRTGRGRGLIEVLLVALRLGLTSFGGPIAHIGYFRTEYVERRRWLDDHGFAELVALTQLLPGPASSQLGIAIGTVRAGRLGGLAAWLGFTLPSAIALAAFAFAVRDLDLADAGWLHGLKVVAVAVVAQAVLSMARLLCPDRTRGSLAVASAILVLAWSGVGAQLVALAAGALAGALALRGEGSAPRALPLRVGRRTAVVCLALFVGLLALLPALRAATDAQPAAVADSFYRTGSLVFGGGHVVLPLLHEEVVQEGWVTNGDFVAGYGAAQAVPGPLSTFAAYLGAVAGPEPNGVPGAALALVAIFLPSFLLVWGVVPLWSAVRARPRVRAALLGVNAAVVGLLAAALYDPIWTSAIREPADLALGLGLFALLVLWRLPPLVVVALGAAGGAILGAV